MVKRTAMGKRLQFIFTMFSTSDDLWKTWLFKSFIVDSKWGDKYRLQEFTKKLLWKFIKRVLTTRIWELVGRLCILFNVQMQHHWCHGGKRENKNRHFDESFTFTVWNDRLILIYQDTCKNDFITTNFICLKMMNSAHTFKVCSMEILWAISKYISDGLLTEAQSFPFYFLKINEGTNQTLEQKLIFFMLFIY